MAKKGRPRRDHYSRGEMLGKYRIVSLLGEGGFAKVYKALDVVEARDVALKVPHEHLLQDGMDELLREVRITVTLDHPHILPIRNATFVGNRLVIAYPLGERSLAARLKHRIASRTVLDIADQLLDAVAYAHARRVIHCDINPDNVILFDGHEARLTDFGIARFAFRTRMSGSGSGTIGYMAPEQALGQPSFRSDVFSLGMVTYRMFTGQLPKWPFDWPPPGIQRLRRKVKPELVAFLKRAMHVNEKKRFKSAIRMQTVFEQIVRRGALRE